MTGETETTRGNVPDWMVPIRDSALSITGEEISSFLPPKDSGARPGAVLMLFGEGPKGPDLLLTERAHDMRSHPGQVSFPGGSIDPDDAGPVEAALREAEEETGLDPSGVQVFATLPALYIPVSDFVVTPVLAWWRRPTPVSPVDPAETARVFRVPVSDLTDPANRATAVHPSGYRGAAFAVGPALVWGFTAGVIDRLLHLAGWERPWDRDRVLPLDWHS